jgi:hypothetical protein
MDECHQECHQFEHSTLETHRETELEETSETRQARRLDPEGERSDVIARGGLVVEANMPSPPGTAEASWLPAPCRTRCHLTRRPKWPSALTVRIAGSGRAVARP